MLWAFWGSLAGQFSNPYGKVAFQSKIYNKIDPNTDKYIITSTHCFNRDMHNISTSVNIMTIHFLEGMRLICIS